VKASQDAVEAAQANLVTVKETARATAVLMPMKPTPIKPEPTPVVVVKAPGGKV
jgi:hypothetical protein